MFLDNQGVSVVCTTFNDENEIQLLLDDLIVQTVLPNQLVVADGGSKDNTVNIVKEFQKISPFPIVVLSGSRLNISQGLNAAIKESIFEFIAIVGTGNRYEPDYIEKLKNRILSSNADVVFPPIRGRNDIDFCKLYCDAFLNGNDGNRIPSNHGGIIRREVFKKYGLFYTEFIYAGEDAEFYNRLKANDCKIVCAEDARLKWDVPHNINQLNKQFKNYMIASLQMEDCRSLFRHYKRQFRIILAFILAIIFFVFFPFYIGVIELILTLIYLIKPKLNLTWSEYYLREYKMWYQLFMIIKYRRYNAIEYRVNLSNLEYLLR